MAISRAGSPVTACSSTAWTSADGDLSGRVKGLADATVVFCGAFWKEGTRAMMSEQEDAFADGA